MYLPRPRSRMVGRARVRARAAFLAAFVLASLAGVVAPGAASPRQAHAGAAVDAVSYDLAADEAIGGHTIARHVGRTDAELAARLRREPRISAASSYPDLDTARLVVGLALESSRERVRAWSRRAGPRPNLVLNYVSRAGPPIGRSLRRGERTASPCDRAVVVLRWHDRRQRWYVLTSYPETQR